MNTTYIKIEKKHNGKIQYLTEVLPQIPTNTILYKKLTGLGATYRPPVRCATSSAKAFAALLVG